MKLCWKVDVAIEHSSHNHQVLTASWKTDVKSWFSDEKTAIRPTSDRQTHQEKDEIEFKCDKKCLCYVKILVA